MEAPLAASPSSVLPSVVSELLPVPELELVCEVVWEFDWEVEVVWELDELWELELEDPSQY